MTTKIWTDLPNQAYSIEFNGQRVGVGMHPVWDAVPGAWNILSLLMGPDLEDLLAWKQDPGEFPVNLGAIPYAVAMALQQASAEQTWGDLAATLTPAQFLKVLKEHPGRDKMILPAMFPNEFWKRAEAKAASYHNYPDNVVRGNFGVH